MRWYDSARWMTAAAALVMIVAVGCNDQSGSKTSGSKTSDQNSSKQPPSGEPMRAPNKMGEANTPNPAYGSSKTAQATPHKSPEPRPQPKQPEKAQPVVAAEPKPAEPAPVAAPENDLEKKRSQAEDMIYATIRVKMEEAITERAKLLKEGVNPADERVRKLEGTIMRARSLLTENGEIVADVEPPIVEVQKQ